VESRVSKATRNLPIWMLNQEIVYLKVFQTTRWHSITMSTCYTKSLRTTQPSTQTRRTHSNHRCYSPIPSRPQYQYRRRSHTPFPYAHPALKLSRCTAASTPQATSSNATRPDAPLLSAAGTNSRGTTTRATQGGRCCGVRWMGVAGVKQGNKAFPGVRKDKMREHVWKIHGVKMAGE
jgi:hypothetical protein